MMSFLRRTLIHGVDWLVGCMNGWTDRWVGGWVDGQAGSQTDRCVCMYVCMDRWIDGQIIHVFSFFNVKKYYSGNVKSLCSIPFDGVSCGQVGVCL
jgi:hypothetical protein